MTRRDKDVGIASWLVALGWLGAFALGLWVTVPILREDPKWFAWIVTLVVIVAALSLVTARLHGHALRMYPAPGHGRARMPRPERTHGVRKSAGSAPRWYRGRSHSGERPQFD